MPNTIYITYSNHFTFEGVKLAFRKKLLFCIDKVPALIPFNEIAQCWIVKRKQLTKLKAKELLINEPLKIDVSGLQWYKQIELDKCFNLC